MTTVVFHRRATADFIRARRWYARHGGATVAGRFERMVGDARDAIATDPTAGTASKPPYLWVKVKRYPYVLHYGPLGLDRWRIYAVAHTSRRPGYWFGRTRGP